MALRQQASFVEQIHNDRNILFISLSQFGIAFSFNFVIVFIPFYIHKVSPYAIQATLIWVGLIMGSSSFMAAIASTFWGQLSSRLNPKTLYLKGLLSHAILTFLMGFVTSLPLLLAIRVVLGTMGGISTLGLIIVLSSTTSESASRNIGFFQNAMTMGTLLGPPIGALAASTLGYKGAFISASTLIFVTLGFCYFFVADVQRKPKPKSDDSKHLLSKRSLIAWTLCFAGTVQLMFLPGILPNVFEALGIGHSAALRWSGLFVMSYTATAMIGTYLLCRVATKTGKVRLILWVGGLGALLQSLFAVCPGIASFVVVRMVQTALIAAILPLTFSLFASELNGKVIGFLNAGRFAGNAMGPIIGTSVLAFSNLTVVYLFVSVLSVLAVVGFAINFRDDPGRTVEPQ